MDQGLIFWDKYFRSQMEVTWDEFAIAFSTLLLDYGKIHLDQDQLLFIKSLLDPDYRNIVKVAHFLIFQDTVIGLKDRNIQKYYILYWKVPSKKQALFKHNFKVPHFEIPSQIFDGLSLQILGIANGYAKGERDIFMDRLRWVKTSFSQQRLYSLNEEHPTKPYLQSMYIVQTPQEEYPLKTEEVFLLGNSHSLCDMINTTHLKIIWTPYNCFLMKDMSKSFRTSLRLQPGQYYLIDYLSVYKLGPETSFFIQRVSPLPKFRDENQGQNVMFIETAQENTDNYLHFLLQQLESMKFKSVSAYRHAIDLKEVQTPYQLSQLSQSSVIKQEGPILLVEFLSGPSKGKQYPLSNKSKGEFLIGRSKECDIQIQDHFLQNIHNRITYNEDVGWLIQHIEGKDKEMSDPTIFGSFLLLANKTQLDLGLQSRAHVIQQGMAINVGPYLFQASYNRII